MVKLEASQKTLSAGLSLINVEAAKRHARMMQGLWAIGCGLLLALCEGAIGLLVWLLS